MTVPVNDPPPVVDPTPVPANDPPVIPTPPPTPTPSTTPMDRLDKLEGVVDGLITLVEKILPNDDQPTKKPWTHIGSREK